MFLFKYGKTYNVVFTDEDRKRHRISTGTSKYHEAMSYIATKVCKLKIELILSKKQKNLTKNEKTAENTYLI